MKKCVLIGFVSFFIVYKLSAQFYISGNLKQYPEKEIYIQGVNPLENIEITKIKTDKNGDFKYIFPNLYKGLLSIYFSDVEMPLTLISDNKDIVFSFDKHNLNKVTITKSLINKAYYKGVQAEGLQRKKNILKQLLREYSSKDTFYPLLNKELSDLKGQIKDDKLAVAQYPWAEEMLGVSEVLSNRKFKTLDDIKSQKKNITNLLTDKKKPIIQLGLLPAIFFQYFQIVMYLNQNEQGELEPEGVKKDVEALFNEIPLERRDYAWALTIQFFNMRETEPKPLLNYYLKEVRPKMETLNTLSQNKIKRILAMQPGQLAYNLKFPQPIDGKHYLYDIKSKYKILFFWDSTCSHCRNEMPYVASTYLNLKAKGVFMVSFSSDRDPKAYESYLKTSGISFPVFCDFKLKSDYFDVYGINVTPSFILLDAQNRIIGRYNHLKDLTAKIK